eukprot:2105001-Pleurochrysis_carterae.AAC.1
MLGFEHVAATSLSPRAHMRAAEVKYHKHLLYWRYKLFLSACADLIPCVAQRLISWLTDRIRTHL